MSNADIMVVSQRAWGPKSQGLTQTPHLCVYIRIYFQAREAPTFNKFQQEFFCTYTGLSKSTLMQKEWEKQIIYVPGFWWIAYC